MKFLNYLVLLALAGCASAPQQDYRFIEIPPEINKNPDKALSQEEVSFDIEQAVYALENAYSGSQHLPNGEFKTMVENIQSTRGPLTAQNFCHKVDSYMCTSIHCSA